jgi:hypothetical protein
MNARLFAWIEKAASLMKSLKKVKYFIFILLGLLAAFLFYTFRNKYFLLGDFTLRVGQTMKQEFLMTEYLTMKLLYHISTFLGRHGMSPIQSFVLVSCAAGGIFVTMFCFIADLLGKTLLQKCLLLVGGISSGMLLLFCGYLDIYALPVAFTSVYLYMTLKYSYKKSYFWPALICLALAIASHLLCMAFAPALVIAWYHHHKHQLPLIAKMTNRKRLFLIITLVLVLIIIVYNRKTGFVLPIHAPPKSSNYMTLFSSSHIWEFINGQLLGCGISLLIILVALYSIIRNKLSLSPQVYLLMASSAGILLIVFLANLQRGSGDWDISSLTAVTMNVLLMLLLLRLYEAKVKFASYLIIIVLIYNSFNMALWVHINSNQKSLAKTESMLVNDPGTYYSSKLAGIIQLIYIYKENKLTEDAKRLSLHACDVLPSSDIRGCMMYADMLVEEKKITEVRVFYEELLQKNPFVPQAYIYLIYSYQDTKEDEKILPMIVRFYNAFKAQPNYFLLYLKPINCLEPIEYLYNYTRQTNPSANLNEMAGVVAQLKRLNASQPK